MSTPTVIHELTTLEIKVFSNASVYAALEKALPEAGGTLLGAFATDIGELSRVLVLRAFDDANALMAARQKLLLSSDPLGCAEWLLSLRSESYALFPFLPQPQAGAQGRWYEFRTYGLRQGLMGQTLEAWREAVPARHAMSPLVGAFTALDGEQPRFLNIWAYDSLEQRSQVRADAVKQGVWPPKGGPASLTTMTSWVCAPTPFSPMR